MKASPKPDTVPDGPQRFALYRRVSTEGQDDKDISLPAQRRQQLDFVQKEKGVVAFEFEDGGISGRTAGRAQFQEAVAAAKSRQYDVLLIHKSDRVFRNRDDAFVYKAMLKKFGVTLISVTEPWVGGTLPGEKLMEGIMECINEFYSDNLSLEVKKGLREIAEGKGRQGGLAPYGFGYVNPQVQGSGWQVIEEEAAWVRWMYEQFAGGLTVADIARQLNALGVPPYAARQRGRAAASFSPGTHWTHPSVTNILRNAVYLGRVQHSGEWFDGAHPALVDAALWETVRVLRQRRGSGRTEQSQNGLFVGGLLSCPHCGSRMAFERGRDRPGGPYRERYQCSAYKLVRLRVSLHGPPGDADGRVCPGFGVSQPRVLELITQALSSDRSLLPIFPSSAPPLPDAKHVQRARDVQKTRDTETRRASLHAESAKLARMRQGYLDLAASGDMRVEELRESLRVLEERQAVLEAGLIEDEAAPSTPLTPAVKAHLLGVLRDDRWTIRQKRDALRLSVDRFIVWPGKDGVDIVLR